MKTSRKIFLFFLITIFLVSGTGLPISIHLCQMMKETSMVECDMCKNHKSACCSNDTALIIKKSGHQGCCDTKIAAEPLKDRYITVKENGTLNLDSYPAEIPVSIISYDARFSIASFISGSPPKFIHQDICLKNSILLI